MHHGENPGYGRRRLAFRASEVALPTTLSAIPTTRYCSGAAPHLLSQGPRLGSKLLNNRTFFETNIPVELRQLAWMPIVSDKEQEASSGSVSTAMKATMVIKADIASIIHIV